MSQPSEIAFIYDVIEQTKTLILTPLVESITLSNIAQALITLTTFFGAVIISRRSIPIITAKLDQLFTPAKHQVLKDALLNVVFPFTWLLLQSLAISVANIVHFSSQLLSIVSVLLLAWIIIRLSAGFVSNRNWSKVIALVAWSIAALSVVGWLEPLVTYLDETSFSLGKHNITPLGIIKAVLLSSFMIWAAVAGSRAVDNRIRKSRTLTPSMQELTSKTFRFLFITFAITFTITSLGIDLTAFAFFSGALGVGIGFGLRVPASNLICGIILLMDRSIKPGDVIELPENNYGWVNMLGARFVSVITRDGKEHLIPNEMLVASQVVNWSYSDTNIRIKVPVRVCYTADVPKAMDLLVEAALETPRIMESPAPRCLILGFHDDGIHLELRIWTSDPINGVANLRSAVLLRVWEKFNEHNISFPVSQKDVKLDLTDDAIEKLADVIQQKKASAPRKTLPGKQAEA